MERVLCVCALNVVVLASMLIVIEGIMGYTSAIHGGMSPQLAERRHTMYDPELGWVNEANVQIPDMYGHQVGLRTNGQGFRNDHDFANVVPDGRIRVICSGDSFTLGYGVDNDHTWCQRLTSLDRRLETINMGQGGYGFDQAYLWYKGDGMAFEHQVHVFAFITEDFRRIASADFMGYSKPVLTILDGALVVTGVPVPRPGSGVSQRLREGARRLHTVTVLQGLLRRLGLTRSDQTSPLRLSGDNETRAVVVKILEDLKRLNDARSRTLMLVYLPTPDELVTGSARPWREFIGIESRALGITLVDAFNTFESLPVEMVDSLFIAEGELDYPGAEGHLTVKGNELVATLIYVEIKKHLPNSTGLPIAGPEVLSIAN